jgi:hypothetical protein
VRCEYETAIKSIKNEADELAKRHDEALCRAIFLVMSAEERKQYDDQLDKIELLGEKLRELEARS